MSRVLLIDENRGIYIPRKFYENFDLGAWGLNKDDFKDLSDVDNEHYWDAWDELLRDAKHTDDQGKTWYLEQDGDLFAVTESEEENE